MKTTVKSIIGSIMIIAALSMSGYGQEAKTAKSEESRKSTGVATQGKISTQESLSVQRHRRFEFDDESTVAETKIKSSEEYNYLAFEIATALYKGSIVVDILDPKGVNQGTFTLVADEPSVVGGKTKYTGSVIGKIQKQFRHPMKGEWIIRATPTNAKGSIDVATEQKSVQYLDYVEMGLYEKR